MSAWWVGYVHRHQEEEEEEQHYRHLINSGLLGGGKSSFLTILLSPEFDFGHQTSKPDILDHRTIKTVYIWPFGCFEGWFCWCERDVAVRPTCQLVVARQRRAVGGLERRSRERERKRKEKRGKRREERKERKRSWHVGPTVMCRPHQQNHHSKQPDGQI